MTGKRVPSANTRWVVILKSPDGAEELWDTLESLGCEVRRDIEPTPLRTAANDNRVAIGTMGPPNLNDFLREESVARWIDSMNPQIESQQLF